MLRCRLPRAERLAAASALFQRFTWPLQKGLDFDAPKPLVGFARLAQIVEQVEWASLGRATAARVCDPIASSVSTPTAFCRIQAAPLAPRLKTPSRR